MTEATPPELVRSVFHVTDFSPASEVAFAHALAIALVRKAELTLLHAAGDATEEDWQRFPAVRRTLERWGLLDPGSERREVFEKLAIQVKKVNIGASRPVSAILDYLENSPSDLIVVSYDAKSGALGVSRDATAEDLARRSGALTLFVPGGSPGFVSPRDGTLSLRRILVPISRDPAPSLAVESARRVGRVLGDPPVDVTLVHIGEADAPVVALPDDDIVRFRQIERGGAVIDGILAAADETGTDLIAMVTNGRSSLGEIARGSHTERVVRRARCPVLALPESRGARLSAT